MQLDGVSRKVFEDRYAAKDEEGKAIEHSPEEMWHRVAKNIAEVEASPEAREEAAAAFYDALADFKFVPGGRILSGAGTKGHKTFYNCFVIPSPEDSRGGIMASITTMAEIMARGGGVGVNISSLRPKGSYVKGVNGRASGAVSFGGLYSYTTGLITQGGSRRGALMLMLDISHPDIEEFITIKRTMGVITNANLSVCVSDSFMEAVKNDGDWDLVWGGKIYKTVKARYLWDLICESAWASGEPGVVFTERYNKMSNTWYFEKIICVNPCVTGDTLISTNKGIKSIEDLYNEQRTVSVLMDKRLAKQKFHPIVKIIQSGIKNTYRLKTREGYELKLTAEHKVKTARGWIEAQKLILGDKIFIANRGGGFGAEGSLEWGRTLGWFIGDGHYNNSKNAAVLSFFGSEKKELSPVFCQTVNNLCAVADERARQYTISWYNVFGRDEARISSQRLARLLSQAGVNFDEKLIIPKSVWRGTEEMQCGFLQGLFTADGHVSGTRKKGVSVRLTSVSPQLLKQTQVLLLNFGIFSRIYENRREQEWREMPDNKGGQKSYLCQAQHDLVISKDALILFKEKINFLTSEKQNKLAVLLSEYGRGPYKNKFLATFEKLKYIGREIVYDLTEPVTHSFIANGLVVHNCGEQGLGAWGVCNLGAINLAEFVKNGDVNWPLLGKTVRTAVRFLDNVIDTTEYYFPENREAQMQIRRVGLGTMGLADMLIKLKIRYGSNEAVAFCEKLYLAIRDEAYRASVELAKTRGSFSQFDKEKYLESFFIKQLPEDIRDGIAKCGIRNAVLLTQAPTGTTSLLSGVSSGIEPVYDFVVIRKDRLGEHEILHSLYKEFTDSHPGESLPPHFVTAKELTPEEHVKMQAVIQKYVDASISKTVNAPNIHTLEDVKKLYIMAYELGCKGIAYYRDGSRDAAVLMSKTEKVKQTDEPEKVASLPSDKELKLAVTPKPRPEIVGGKTYKIKTGYGTLYVTVNNDDDGKPFEVFANIGKAGGFFAAKSEAICRLISLALRAGIDAQEITEQLRGIRGPMPIWSKYGQVLSIPDAISHILREHINSAQQKLQLEFKDEKKDEAPALDENKIKTLPAAQMDARVAEELHRASYAKITISVADRGLAPECPHCRNLLEMSEGCMLCRSCGYSRCS